MPFTKGNKINLGKKMSDIQKQNIGNANRGKKRTSEQIKRISEAVKKNPSRYWLGKKLLPHMVEALKKANKGKSHNKGKKLNLTKERLQEMSDRLKSKTGSNSIRWIKDRTLLKNQESRDCILYKHWRDDVFKRDDFRCQICKRRNGKKDKIKLNADHIKSWINYPELRYIISNGRTLCVDCHKKSGTWGKPRYMH
jgi:hypothetical protein